MMSDFDPIGLLNNAFPNVDHFVLAAIARLAKVKTYQDGTILCKEGESGDTFYLVADGEVEITKKMTGGEDRLLRRGGQGEFFGEMALLHDTMRSATVTTVQNTTVLELDRNTFVAAIQQNPSMVLTIIRTMIERMRANDKQTLADLQIEKEKVEAAYEELRQQEQKRNEFLDTLAHELRTPLTAAKGYIDLAKVGVLQGAAFTMGVEKIEFYFKRITSLINDLLFVQKMELLDFGLSKVDVADVLREAIDSVKATSGAHTIRLHSDENIPLINADHDGLLRAFSHLLDNAVKFSPKGGDIDIKLSASHFMVKVDFIDYGVGIPPEFMSRLFKRFERIEKYQEYLFGGLGLGLPIVKHIINRHGGNIDVQSEYGKGSVFSVHLPVDNQRSTLILDVPEWVDVPDETENSANKADTLEIPALSQLDKILDRGDDEKSSSPLHK